MVRPRQFQSVLIALAAFGASAAWAQGALETEVKATFLYKFAPFVEWPANVWTAPGAPFSLCVVGPDPFGPVLDRAVAGQAVAGHPILVRRSAAVDKAAACQILYAGGPPAEAAKTLRAVHGQPVLTVTDGGAAPGIIDFAIDQGRVRFRIDDAEAAEDNLSISSKLLTLALSVKPRKTAGAGP